MRPLFSGGGVTVVHDLCRLDERLAIWLFFGQGVVDCLKGTRDVIDDDPGLGERSALRQENASFENVAVNVRQGFALYIAPTHQAHSQKYGGHCKPHDKVAFGNRGIDQGSEAAIAHGVEASFKASAEPGRRFGRGF